MKNIILLLLLIFAPLQISAQTKSVEELIEHGSGKMDSELYQEAIPFLKLAIEKEHNNHLALNKLGICYFELKDYDKAKENFRKAILYSDKQSYYFANLGATYSRLGDDEKAYEYARKALEIEESDLSLFNAVSLASNVDRADKCIDLLNKSTLEKHNDFNTLYGRCYYKKKNYKNSIQKYELYFQNIDKSEKFVEEINDEEEKNILTSAYFFEVASDNIDEETKNEYLSKLKNLLNEKENTIDLFFNADHLCSKYEYTIETCEKVFNSLVDSKLSEMDALQYQYYILNDYEKVNQLARQLSEKKHTRKDLFTIRLMRYLSVLQLFSKDYLQNNNTPNLQLLSEAEELFKNLYEPGKIYTDEEFMENKELQLPVEKTIAVFRKGNYANTYERKKVGKYVLKILIQIPNQNVQTKLNEELQNLNNEN